MKTPKKKDTSPGIGIAKQSLTEKEVLLQRRPSFIRLDALGELIQRTREQNRMTQSQLAEILKMDKTYVSKMENNLKIQRLDTMIKVLHALNGQLILRFPSKDGMEDTELV